jgi:hypothetical protein
MSGAANFYETFELLARMVCTKSNERSGSA